MYLYLFKFCSNILARQNFIAEKLVFYLANVDIVAKRTQVLIGITNIQ